MSQFEQKQEPAMDMKRFRRALRVMWNEMQRMHREEGFVYRSPDGVLKFRKIPFPEMEVVGERRRNEDVL